jgi:hypothetical protein
MRAHAVAASACGVCAAGFPLASRQRTVSPLTFRAHVCASIVQGGADDPEQENEDLDPAPVLVVGIRNWTPSRAIARARPIAHRVAVVRAQRERDERGPHAPRWSRAMRRSKLVRCRRDGLGREVPRKVRREVAACDTHPNQAWWRFEDLARCTGRFSAPTCETPASERR